jgi:hypothetical protein
MSPIDLGHDDQNFLIGIGSQSRTRKQEWGSTSIWEDGTSGGAVVVVVVVVGFPRDDSNVSGRKNRPKENP